MSILKKGRFRRFILSSGLLCISLLHADMGEAALTCYQCHGSPGDNRPVDAAYRDMTSGGFAGNHRTHLDPAAVPASCTPCHPGSSSYTPHHRDGLIKVSGHVNGSPAVTSYRNTT